MARNDATSSQSFFSNFLNNFLERREQRKEERFLNSLPKPYAAFFERFSPTNPADQEIFDKLKYILSRNPAIINNFDEEFAQIGDSALLQHLWKETPVNVPDTRLAIVENARCPKEIILDAISDPFTQVAHAAVLSPLLSEADCLEAVNRIDKTCYPAVKALEDRLEKYGYRVDWTPWLSDEKYMYRKEPVIHRIQKDHSEVPRDKDQQKKTSSLDDIISDAKGRSETKAQTESRAIHRGLSSENDMSL